MNMVASRSRARVLCVLLQCPGDVLAHDCRGVVTARGQCSDDRGFARRVAECDRQIAQPALVAGATDRAAGRASLPFGLGPTEQLHEAATVERVPRREVVDLARVREFVPWAEQL